MNIFIYLILIRIKIGSLLKKSFARQFRCVVNIVTLRYDVYHISILLVLSYFYYIYMTLQIGRDRIMRSIENRILNLNTFMLVSGN